MKNAPNRKTIPSYAILRSFEAAARHESFTLASEELHLTQSAISRQVKDLEFQLNIKLFRRVGRRVVLTEAGKSLSIELAADMERIRQTILKSVERGNQGTRLRIATLPTFSTRWLIPRIPLFMASNPDTVLNFETRLKPFDLSEEKFDFAIHYGTMDWPKTKMVKICDEILYPMCSPALNDKYDLSKINNLITAPLLHLNSRPDTWSNWFSSNGLDRKMVESGNHFDQFSMIIAAAKASMGVAMLPTFLVENEISDGKLMPINRNSFTNEKSYYVVSPHGVSNPSVEKFTKWIKSQVTKPTNMSRQKLHTQSRGFSTNSVT